MLFVAEDVAPLSPAAAQVAAFTDIPIKEQHHLLVSVVFS